MVLRISWLLNKRRYKCYCVSTKDVDLMVILRVMVHGAKPSALPEPTRRVRGSSGLRAAAYLMNISARGRGGLSERQSNICHHKSPDSPARTGTSTWCWGLEAYHRIRRSQVQYTLKTVGAWDTGEARSGEAE